MVDVEEIFITKKYSDQDIYIDVYAIITNKRFIPNIMELLHEEVSLSLFGLQHLKRIQPYAKYDELSDNVDTIIPNHKEKVKILLCPITYYNELKPHILELCIEKEIVRVCRILPETREEFQEWNKTWPINFHMKQYEKDREKGLMKYEIEQIQYVYQHIMNYQTTLHNNQATLHKDSNQQQHMSSNINEDVVVIMNPINNKIVMTSWDALNYLQSLHYTSSTNDTKNDNSIINSDSISNIINNSNSSNDLDDSINKDGSIRTNTLLFTSIYTPTMLCIEGVSAIVRGDINNNGSLPDNFYLCSGLDLYLIEEPDLLSSFALVHSRIRRVFYRLITI